MTSHELVETYIANNFRVVFWPQIGDSKGPRESGWPAKNYRLEDYVEGYRVGILTGTEIAPGRFLHDIDIDWAPGSAIALDLLPITRFIFGRSSKKISHCFYTTSEPIASFRYEDIDKSCLIELRGTKLNGDIGLQTMAPPSVWSKGTQRESLDFVKSEAPSHIEVPTELKQRVCLSAIGMLLAKHFGKNGFGHEPRLAWAGFLLRAGLQLEDLVVMGEGISRYCDNRETEDVRRSLESTASSLLSSSKKVKGGPALAKILGAKGKSIVSQINSWLGRDSDFIRTSDGMIVKDSQENIKRATQLLNIELSYNLFAERLLISDNEGASKPIDDHALESLWLRIDRECRFRPTFVFYERVIKDLAHEHAFHPVRDYLSKLTWDGVSRIDNWLVTYGGVEETNDSSEARTYLEAVSSIALVAAVRRIMKPGCKYDEMLVLESEQGMNKSSALRALCPTDEFFSDDLPLNVDAKQIIERTLGKWLIEASDLVGGRKADRDHLKSMLSRQIDGPARMAYAHLPVERPRQFIIIGTTNSAEYLADMTGARRFWPVRVKRFDVESIKRDRDQLWAEAVVREAAGESIRLPEELYTDAGAHQEVRREIDAWEEVVTFHLEGVEIGVTGRQQVTADALWTAIGVVPERRDRMGAKRIAEIMQRLGFSRTNVREAEKVQTGYVREVKDSDGLPRLQQPAKAKEDAPF